MEILTQQVIPGPNIYTYKPIIKLQVDLGHWEDWPTDKLPGFREKLLAVLPSLATHHCSLGRPGGFCQRLVRGTYLGHVLEHIALELQALIGAQVSFGTTRSGAAKGIYDVIYEYETASVGLAAGMYALDLLKRLLAGTAPENLPDYLDQLRSLEVREGLGPSTKAICDAAKARGIPCLPLGKGGFLQLGYGARAQRIDTTLSQKTSVIAVDLAGDKERSKRVLQAAGIPVPEGIQVWTKAEAVNAAYRLGWPVVVKPAGANQGKGVALNLHNASEVERAFTVAATYDNVVLVEQAIPGKDYRLLVVGGRLVAAAERIPAHVVGNGQDTIKALVAAVNLDERRGQDHEKPLTKLNLDPASLLVLAKQGLTPEAIPPLGQIVWLRENGNLSTGGTAQDVTASVHPSYAALAVRAARAIGLDIAGVDLVARDISQPYAPGQGAVIEVNAAPGLRMHLYPSEGKAQPVGQAIVAYLFPGDNPPWGPGRIPIAAITGTNGKTTTTRLVGHILAQEGLKVGMTTSDGIYLGNECLLPGDNTGPWSTTLLLRDPQVEAVVLEVARGGIIRGGLGYESSDIAIITNISEDHLGQNGIESLEDLAEVKALVVECVRPGGWAVLNADDPLVAGLATRLTKGSRPFFFSLDAENPHLKSQRQALGPALWVEGGRIMYAPGPLNPEVSVLTGPPVQTIPITCQGLAQYNLPNALAALGGALALGVSWQAALAALQTFTTNPGRFNLFAVGQVRVLIDYGHNPAGYLAVLTAIEQMVPFAQRIGIIGVPGDRTDSLIKQVGAIAAAGFARLFIKEDADLRGRKPGEVAKLLETSATAAGGKAITVVLSEAQAVKAALKVARPGDLVVIFYEKYQTVWQAVQEYCAAVKITPQPLYCTPEAPKQEVAHIISVK